MSFLKWDPILSVNNEEIDSQHQELINLLANFYQNIQNKTSKDNLVELLKGIKDYTIVHFSYEEKVMQENNYPIFDAHKKQHEIFVDKVKDLYDRFETGKLVLSFEVTSFLRDWIKKHILEADKKFWEYKNSL